ncbi:hypothetical protein OPT61_g9372 [Boeremia exigua]|uniref:Uncharacterized protein n=1 Tax=Boeremia exigua TaxID=749465 RepID=A0ACC2HUX8_9PLEO|nr:hypothetical protein OPT61_g9372 [Boeremia exigua]
MDLPLSRSGLGSSSVQTHVVVSLIAGNMLASSRVIDRIRTRPIVHDLQMSSRTVLVARRICQRYRARDVRRARMPSRIARSRAIVLFDAATSANSCATKASAGHVWRQSPLHADADATPSTQFVTKEPRKRPSVCAFAVSPSIADGTSVASTAVLGSVKLPSGKQVEGNLAPWNRQRKGLATTLRQSISAHGRAVAS